jgi:hypothetical protein
MIRRLKTYDKFIRCIEKLARFKSYFGRKLFEHKIESKRPLNGFHHGCMEHMPFPLMLLQHFFLLAFKEISTSS